MRIRSGFESRNAVRKRLADGFDYTGFDAMVEKLVNQDKVSFDSSSFATAVRRSTTEIVAEPTTPDSGVQSAPHAI